MRKIAKVIWGRCFKIARNTTLFFCLILIAAFNYLPQVYSSFNPPIRYARIDYQKSHKGFDEYSKISVINGEKIEEIVKTEVFILYGSFTKQRCKFSSLIATGYSKTRGEVSLDVDFRDRASGGQSTNRPTGYHEYGPWLVTTTPRGDIWGIKLTAVHICGPEIFYWVSYTDMGEVILTDRIKER